jgi:ABC-2 type transport system ATP-binding protein
MDVSTSPAGPTPTARVLTAGPAIEARGLRKTYGGRVAVEGLDLEVARGTVLGFLGPNGAGKTTAIRMLSTVLRPDRGSFAVAGLPHTRPAEIRRRIGVLPESAGYPPAQTAEEWLVYHARLFGSGRRAARSEARRLLADVGLEERARSRIAGLSRGLRQRLGIARALVNNPEIVFLDEPTLGLDPGGQRQVLELVARVARDHGVTVVLSTHTLAEVEQVCNRVVILHHGRIVADGTVRDIMRRAAAPRRGIVQVPAELRTRAVEALDHRRISAREAIDGRQDEVELTLPADLPAEESATAALRCLLDAGVPVLGFTLEGGRLSDAFLSVTEGSSDE